jgi:hypothetical protein
MSQEDSGRGPVPIVFRLVSAEYTFRYFWKMRGDLKVKAFLRGQAEVIREIRKHKPCSSGDAAPNPPQVSSAP